MSRLSSASVFSYTAQKGRYLSIWCSLLFLLLSESMLVVFLAIHFIPFTSLKAFILVLFACFFTALFWKLLSPLWTKHRLSATELELHYGLAVHVRLPRSLVGAVQPVQEKLGSFALPRYDASRQRLSLAFSEQGQVLLCLKQSVTVRLNWRVRLVEQILLHLDDREAFLAALDPVRSTQAEPSVAGTQQVLAPQKKEPYVFRQFASSEPRQSSDDTPIALQAKDLTRRYTGLAAVDHLNLTVRRGEIYGFLGPNGAGKSTTIKMLVGLLQPTAGCAYLAGYDVWREPLQAKMSLGYVADRALLYTRLSGREFLAFLGQLRGLSRQRTEERIVSLLDLLELTDAAERLCGSYSLGMKRKLALAGALLHEPEVLILDEPFNGLDPRSIRRLKDLFAQLARSGTTIFLSTHDLATAEEMCQRVGILDRGHLLAEGHPAELRAQAAATDLESVFLDLTAPSQEVRA